MRRRTQFFGVGGILCLLGGSFIPVTGNNEASATGEAAPTINIVSGCADPPTDCKSPVKYLGENDGCACFTCEYGRKTQRIVCTANENDKNTLMAQTKPK
jgi:hypothetical protein